MRDQLKVWNVFVIIIGTAIMGFGINCFNLANGIAEGGITGITLLLKFLLDWDPYWVNLVMNLPLLLFGWRLLGTVSFVYSVIGTLSLSAFLWAFEDFSLPLKDPLLAALYAGVTVGIGFGIIFRYGGTTEGLDILARLANRRWGWSIGRFVLVSDFGIVLLSLLYLDLNRAMYTLVSVSLGARVIDFIQEGANAAKAATIVSNSYREISDKVVTELKRGTTLIQGVGGYSGEHKTVIYCVVNRREIVKLKLLVQAVDPQAFIIVNDVNEVQGQGF